MKFRMMVSGNSRYPLKYARPFFELFPCYFLVLACVKISPKPKYDHFIHGYRKEVLTHMKINKKMRFHMKTKISCLLGYNIG